MELMLSMRIYIYLFLKKTLLRKTGGYFLLKKANYINKQKSQEDVKRKFEDEFNKVLHQDELDAIRSRELEASLKNKDKE